MAIIIDYAKNLPINDLDISSFYDNNWKRKTALSIDNFFKWQFKSPPENRNENYCLIAYDNEGGNICGVMGLHKRKFKLGTNLKNGAELTTWIVDQNYHGKGIGGRIIKKLQKDFDVLIGMGITDEALPIYLKSKFRFLRYIPRFTKVYNNENINKILETNKLSNSLIKKNKTIRKDYQFISLKNDTHLPFNNLNSFSRENHDIEWRYNNHPIFNYQSYIILCSKNKHKCQISYRVEDSIKNLKVLHITDFIPENNEAALSALTFIDDFCQEKRIDIADFYCTASTVNKFFLASGWFSTIDDKHFQFPHLFHPIELRSPPTTSLIYWAKDPNDFIEISDFSNFYITKQDADLDRPTFDTYHKA